MLNCAAVLVLACGGRPLRGVVVDTADRADRADTPESKHFSS
jgi:hypothetical protein